jgi:hypothetical protein
MALCTLSGTFQNPDSTPVNAGLLVLTLSQNAVESGTSQVAPTVISLPLTAEGAISGTPQVYGNDGLLPANTIYFAKLFAGYVTQDGVIVPSGPSIANFGGAGFYITGTSFNFNDAIPVAIDIGVFSASNLTNGTTGSGAVVLTNSPSLTTPTIAGGALSGNFTGNPEFSGAMTAASISGVYFVDGTTYSGIAAALAAISVTTAKSGFIFTTLNETFTSNPFAGLPTDMNVTIFMSCRWTTSVQLLIKTAGIVIYGSGRNDNGTISSVIQASGLPSSTSVVCIGDDTTSYQGTRLENLAVDAGSIAGSNCLEMYGAAENSGARNCVFINYANYGVYMHGQNTTNFQFDNNTINPSPSAGTTSSVGIYINGAGGNTNAISRCTISGYVVSSGLQAAGVEIINSTVHLYDIHAEECTDAILFGSGSNGIAEHIIGGGGSPGPTNEIHIASGSGAVTILHASDSSATNIIKNDNTSLTIPTSALSTELCFYYAGGSMGNGEFYYFGGSGGLQTTTPLTIDAATPTGSVNGVSFGDTTGFGNGSSGTAVTTTTKSTGTGPTTPQTVVGYLEINIGGTVAWVPYCH